jgi:hypothetical protein
MGWLGKLRLSSYGASLAVAELMGPGTASVWRVEQRERTA